MRIDISLSKYIDMTPAGRELLKYHGKGYWVHFTRTPKLGVNFRHLHSDINGVYFYPVDWVLENAKFEQYAVTYQYYYIVQIIQDPKHGYDLTTMTDKQYQSAMSKYKLTLPESREWRAVETPGFLFYEALKQGLRDEKRNIIPDLWWLESRKGEIHGNEPEQIVVRNPKIIKVIKFGDNNVADTTTIVKDCAKRIAQAVGGTLKAQRDKGKIYGYIVKVTDQYYTPLVLTVYPYKVWNDTEIHCRAVYKEWRIAHGAIMTTSQEKSFSIMLEDDSNELVQFAQRVLKEWLSSDRRLDSAYNGDYDDWRVNFLNKDLEHFNPIKQTIDSFEIHSPYVLEYLQKLAAEKLSNYTYEQFMDELRFLSADALEVLGNDTKDLGEKALDWYLRPNKRRTYQYLRKTLGRKFDEYSERAFKEAEQYLDKKYVLMLRDYLEDEQ